MEVHQHENIAVGFESMPGIQIDTNVREVMAKFHRLPGSMQQAVKRGIGRGLILMQERIKTSTGVKWRRDNSGLKGRLTSHVETTGKFGVLDVDGVIGFRKSKNFPYELAQEFGAKAKPGKAMVVPVSDVAKQLSQRGKGPRDFPGKLFIPKGHHVLMAAGGGKNSPLLVTHYILIKSIAPRLKFRETVLASGDLISKEVSEELGKVTV
jgi:hypothetical protein